MPEAGYLGRVTSDLRGPVGRVFQAGPAGALAWLGSKRLSVGCLGVGTEGSTQMTPGDLTSVTFSGG